MLFVIFLSLILAPKRSWVSNVDQNWYACIMSFEYQSTFLKLAEKYIMLYPAVNKQFLGHLLEYVAGRILEHIKGSEKET